MLKAAHKADARGTQSIGVKGSPAGRNVVPGTARHPLRLAEDIGLAQLWLADGAPIADVITMLEARYRFEVSPADGRALAVQILWAAQGLCPPDPNLNPNPKESRYAAARDRSGPPVRVGNDPH